MGAALVIIISTVLMPRRPDWVYAGPGLVVLCLWAWSRMPFIYALKRLLIAEVFILGIGILTLITPEALPIFLSALIKSNLCVLTLLLLTWTTPFQQILQQLRRLNFPGILLTILALMYRYIPLLADESNRMKRARASRTFSRRRTLAWSNLSNIIGQLFIRSANRAERIYLAMCARGWK